MSKTGSHKKRLGSYPYIGVIVSITLALFVTGLFGMLVIYSQGLEKVLRENVRVQVYLRNGLTETQRLEVEKKLSTGDFIATSANPITFISKEQAEKTFIAETGEDFRAFLGENPLHDAYLVSVRPEYHSMAQMDTLKNEIEGINGVHQVFYLQGLIESINKNVVRIGLILIGLCVLFIITVMLLINNTIRLALFSQRFLIRSMQLVGATRWFIQRPFLLRSAFYGLVAATIASAFVWILSDYAYTKIEDLQLLQNNRMMFWLFGGLAMIGIVITVFSTFMSIRKYLRLSLDELY